MLVHGKASCMRLSARGHVQSREDIGEVRGGGWTWGAGTAGGGGAHRKLMRSPASGSRSMSLEILAETPCEARALALQRASAGLWRPAEVGNHGLH